jgi:hypothetical protein
LKKENVITSYSKAKKTRRVRRRFRWKTHSFLITKFISLIVVDYYHHCCFQHYHEKHYNYLFSNIIEQNHSFLIIISHFHRNLRHSSQCFLWIFLGYYELNFFTIIMNCLISRTFSYLDMVFPNCLHPMNCSL